VAVAILSTALVFVFRSFATVLTAVKLGRNLTLACWLAEEKIWDVSLKVKKDDSAFNANDRQVIQGIEFDSSLSSEDSQINSVPLKTLKCVISWPRSSDKKDNLTLFTYLATEK